jgi:hypothetical protein
MRTSLFRIVFLAAVAAVLAPGSALAQSGFFIGVGGGVSDVRDTGWEMSAVRPLLHLRAGKALGPNLALMVEFTQTGIGAQPRDSVVIDGSVVRADHQLSTRVLLLSAQFGRARSFYVRPGLGFGQHAFTSFYPTSTGYAPATSHEAGVAAGIAVGHEFALRGFPVSTEATALWTQGEDSSSPRLSLGVQLVHDFRF